MNTKTCKVTYSNLKSLLVQASTLSFIKYDCNGNPFNENEEKNLERALEAERELISIGYYDQEGRYINSTNPVFRSAQKWYEKNIIG